jgi:hypothetical protein
VTDALNATYDPAQKAGNVTPIRRAEQRTALGLTRGFGFHEDAARTRGRERRQ